MNLPKCFLLLPAPFLLFPLARWLGHQQVANFFLGLSSQFWTGVTIGISIVCMNAFVALLVLHLYSARAISPGVEE